jgi:hypothetical protein
MQVNNMTLEEAKGILETLKDALDKFPDNMDIPKTQAYLKQLEFRINELLSGETLQ